MKNVIRLVKNAECFPEGSDDYYCQLAIDFYGEMTHNCMYSDLVEIGKKIDKELKA